MMYHFQYLFSLYIVCGSLSVCLELQSNRHHNTTWWQQLCDEICIDSVSFFYFADVPIVSLQFGTILKPDTIKEGDDIYFECIVKARPMATSISWFHNVSYVIPGSATRQYLLTKGFVIGLDRNCIHKASKGERESSLAILKHMFPLSIGL